MSYAAIHIPEFPAIAWLRTEKLARGLAAAVCEGSPPLERVVSFNRAAQGLGLVHGMSKVQAETSGKLVFHARSIVEENAALNLVLEAAQRFSPRVQVVASPLNAYGHVPQLAASLLMDRRGTEMLFGSALSFAAKVRDALRDVGFPANVAAASNAEASLLLCRSCGGASCADEHEVRSRLAALPLTALRCDAATLSILSRWGVRTLGELAALPEAGLVSRIGQQGRRLQRLAAGTESRLLVPYEPALLLADRALLDTALDSLESLLFVLSPMLDLLLKQAANHAYAVRSVTVTLDLEKLAPHEVTIKPAVPSQSREVLLKLLHLKLQAEPPQAGIVAVEVKAEPALPHVAQRGLFQAQFPEPGRLDLLLARLQALAGDRHVGSPVIADSHRDDEFTLAAFRPNEAAGPEESGLRPLRIALRRFRPAQPVTVRLSGGRPVLLFWQGERWRPAQVAGPWQSSGYWWDGRSWEADEWDAVLSAPRLALRLRHEPHADKWFVAGVYD